MNYLAHNSPVMGVSFGLAQAKKYLNSQPSQLGA